MVPAYAYLINGDQGIELQPYAPLSPNTAYTITVAGVTDIAGNGLAKTFTSTFTTGPTAALAVPVVLSVTPANGAQNVPDSTATVVVVFSAFPLLHGLASRSFSQIEKSNGITSFTFS